MTLVGLALARAGVRRSVLGRVAGDVAVNGYSLPLFSHVIPGFTETATRIPEGAPLVASPEAPELLRAVGAAFLVFLAGAALQVRRLRRAARPQAN
jgi:threonine/homoserine/homoserine lactone efflux protein